MKLIQPCQIYTIDELLVGYKSRKSKLIVKYPRKPNPIGYLIYIMSNVSQRYKLPLAVDFCPIISLNETKFDFQINSFSSRLLKAYPTLKNRVHLVTDSAFGSVDLIQTLKCKGVFLTSSMKSSVSPMLWKCMLDGISGFNNGLTLYWSCKDIYAI